MTGVAYAIGENEATFTFCLAYEDPIDSVGVASLVTVCAKLHQGSAGQPITAAKVSEMQDC